MKNFQLALQKFHPQHSLVAQISYATAGVALVLSVVLGYYAAQMSRQQIEQEQGESFARRAQSLVDVLDRGMFERYRELQILASLEDIRQPAIPVQRKRAILEKVQQTFDSYAWIGMCNSEGKGVVGTGHYLEGKDLIKRPWCTKGREKPYIGDVHDALLLSKLLPNPSGEMFYLVDVAAPVHDAKGELQGVLCGHIFWRWAEAMLDSKKSPGIDVLLLSRTGLVLAGPEKGRTPLAELAPETWQAIQSSQHKHDFLLSQWQNGKHYLVGYARDAGYRDYPGLGWVALVRQEADVAFAPAQTLQQRILILGLALGCLFTLIGAVMARRIVQPIARIALAADKVAAGNLNYEAPAVAGDGEVAHLSSAIHTMVNSLTWEILERKNAEAQLTLSATVFANNSEAIVITDAKNQIVRVNAAFYRITGYTEKDVLGKNPRMFASGKMPRDFYQAMWAELLEKDSWRGEIWNKRSNGEVFPEWLILSLVRDEQGRLSHHIAIYSDITQRKLEEEQVLFLASHDMLTRLPNRYLLTDRITQALSIAERNHSKLGVIFIDLDHFKNINDSLGHDVGDELLKQVAVRMAHSLSRTDTLARLGGDEFVAVLPEVSSENEIAFVAEKMLESFTEKFIVREHQLIISPSIGISIYPNDGIDATGLLRNADMAMYRAKDVGRNTLQFYHPEMTIQMTERLRLEMDLRQAFENKQLFLTYQPQVEIGTGKMCSMEALLRWQHPTLGMISPARFIPIAEESGLIEEIGDWVLLEACMQCRIWQAKGFAVVPVAVNVSGVQVKRGHFAERVEKILHETQLNPDLIELEITESVLMNLGENSLQTMTELKALGVGLSLDDFGTGYSSLSRLKAFPLDFLKIDQSFVRDIHTDPDDAAIVRAVMSMAHEMNIQVIAEGVETTEQMQFLAPIHCEKYQGYLFSRAVLPLEIEQYLQKI